MNIPVRYSLRITLAVGLAVLCAEILRYPHAIRATLCASLVSGLPTFRRALMRQRLLLVWLAGMVGIAVETMFRDAPWFFLPVYFFLVYLLYRLASKSRDAATMTIVGYGLSGSLDNMFNGIPDEPIVGGFYRALYCTVGLMAATLAFVLIPLRKPPAASRVRPTVYPTRDLVFLGLCAVSALCLGVITSQYFSSAFITLMALSWGVQLCTIRDKSAMPGTFLGGVIGIVGALLFDCSIAFSTNNFGIYFMAFLSLLFLLTWFKASHPLLASKMWLFSISMVAGTCMVPAPLTSYMGILKVLLSMLVGIVLATILWFIDRALRSFEAMVAMGGVDNEGIRNKS